MKKKQDRKVIRALSMITQFTLFLLVPILGLGGVGLLLDRKLGTTGYSIPGGDTQITAGDHVVLITKSENSKKILSYFAGKQ